MRVTRQQAPARASKSACAAARGVGLTGLGFDTKATGKFDDATRALAGGTRLSKDRLPQQFAAQGAAVGDRCHPRRLLGRVRWRGHASCPPRRRQPSLSQRRRTRRTRRTRRAVRAYGGRIVRTPLSESLIRDSLPSGYQAHRFFPGYQTLRICAKIMLEHQLERDDDSS